MSTFEATDGSRYKITPARFVWPVFDVIHYDGTNGVAVLEWLHGRAKSNRPVGGTVDAYLKMTDDGLRLIRGFDHVEVAADSYIGFGVPPRGDSSDPLRLINFDAASLKQPCELASEGIERWPSS